MDLNEELERIAAELKDGRPVQQVTTREFLSWFGAQRRGYWVVRYIRRQLDSARLQTVPDFEVAYLDAPIEFRAVPSSVTEELGSADESTTLAVDKPVELGVAVSVKITTSVSEEPTYRISKLAAANQGVVSVNPNSTLAASVARMERKRNPGLLLNESQRPTMGEWPLPHFASLHPGYQAHFVGRVVRQRRLPVGLPSRFQYCKIIPLLRSNCLPPIHAGHAPSWTIRFVVPAATGRRDVDSGSCRRFRSAHHAQSKRHYLGSPVADAGP